MLWFFQIAHDLLRQSLAGEQVGLVITWLVGSKVCRCLFQVTNTSVNQLLLLVLLKALLLRFTLDLSSLPLLNLLTNDAGLQPVPLEHLLVERQLSLELFDFLQRLGVRLLGER